MKSEVRKILKEKNISYVWNEDSYELMKQMMKYAVTQDAWLKNYLSLDPLNKSQWIADHMEKAYKIISEK